MNGLQDLCHSLDVEDGRMYGRGVALSKSDFATYAFALSALEAAARARGARLAGTVELHFTYDEEFGGELGPAWLLRRGLTRPDLAICAGFSYAIVNAHNGCLQLEVTVLGQAAHAALPETGVDALAVSIGNAHGQYTRLPQFDLARLEAIRAVVRAPLVLHGGSGTPDADLRRAIALGIAKVNVATDLTIAMRQGLRAELALWVWALCGLVVSVPAFWRRA